MVRKPNGLKWHNLRFPRFCSNRFWKAAIELTILLPRLGQCDQKGSKMIWAATAGLRYRSGRPRTSVTERVSGGGEPHPESSDQGSAVTLTRRKSHLGRGRSPAGTKGAGRSGVHSATGHDSGLVSEAHRKQI